MIRSVPLALSALAVAALGLAQPARAADMKTGDSHVIDLVQVPCQFLGIEKDQGFKTSKAADCKAINAKTEAERLKAAKVLKLKPGKYTFRVTNKDVPYELGFWLRTKGYDWRNPIDKLTKLSVSGGGLTEGMTKDYTVDLKPGEYVYSCPLNPTPDYRLEVSAGG